MTLGVAAPTSSQPTAPHTLPIVILGTDAVLAALPATPVQLAHACLRAGFANVIPASWGDELIAAAVLRRLPQFGSGPAIQCSCPIVAHRLLTVGGDLRPVLLPFVPPPVATARYVRVLARPARTRITYVGACPGAVDESIDIRMTPEALIAMLAERDIVLDEQPRVFESVIPPDRRRFRSQPGGVPTMEALWSELGARTLVEVDSEDFVTEIAQHLLTGKNVLVDVSTRLGCACSGAINGARHPRAQIATLEPPRSISAIVDEAPVIDLELPVPATSRTPVDVVAVSMTPPSSHNAAATHGGDASPANRVNAPRASGPVHEPRPPRLSTPVVPRPVMSGFPVARDVEGKALPRAYVARRRSSPKGIPIMLPPEEPATQSADRSKDTPPAPIVPVPLPPSPVTVSVPRQQSLVSPEPIAEPSALTPPVAAPPSSSPVTSPSASSSTALVPVPAEPVTRTPEARMVESIFVASTPRASASHVSAVAPTRPVASVVAEPDVTSPPPRPIPRVSSTHSVHTSDPVRPRPTQRDTWAPPPPPPPATLSRRQMVLILVAVAMIAVFASTVVAVIIGRSVSAPPTTSQISR